MSGFIRRFSSYPGTDVLTQIEGVAIIDLPPPGSVTGVATGVVAAVGECADMTNATAVDSSGAVTTLVKPQEVFTGQDLINKIGGFDETIGEFGISGGNLFASLRNKKFSRLLVAPVNLCSARGFRVFRELPVCRSQSDANPVVPVLGGYVSAGREFRSGVGRLRAGAPVAFSSLDPITKGVTGNCVSGASAATQVFHANMGLDWTLITRPDGTLGAHKGDILVIGYNNAGAKAPSAEAGTYRVASEPSSGVAITVERLDGANFAFTSQANVPWRLHYASDADSAPVLVPGSASPLGYAAADAGGYVVPVRPLTDSSGAQTDGTYAASTLLTPQTVPTAATGSSWDPLSGLGALTHPSGTTAFTAALQGINAPYAGLDAAYQTAIDALLGDADPIRDTNIVVASRKSTNIRTKLKSHVLQASARGRGRVAVLSPDLSVQTEAAAAADTAPGVGATRDERVVYSWPGERTYIPEAVGFRLRTADGTTTVDGVLDMSEDFRAASVLSNLAPERNPGQAADPVPAVMSTVLGFQRGVATLGIDEYTALRAAGIMALRIDRTSGPIFQSGITSSLVSGQKNINRRRMADFIEDSLAERLVQFSKLPQTNQLKDGAVGEVDAFLADLLSLNNPAAQRIDAYQIDDKSGNTPAMSAKGIFVIIVRVRLTPTSDFIVLQAEIGENVTIQQAA